MGRLFSVERSLVWCQESQSLEPAFEVICGIQTNLGTQLITKRAFVKTMAEANALREELDIDCLDALRRQCDEYRHQWEEDSP
jgi:hypothetical protein